MPKYSVAGSLISPRTTTGDYTEADPATGSDIAVSAVYIVDEIGQKANLAMRFSLNRASTAQAGTAFTPEEFNVNSPAPAGTYQQPVGALGTDVGPGSTGLILSTYVGNSATNSSNPKSIARQWRPPIGRPWMGTDATTDTLKVTGSDVTASSVTSSIIYDDPIGTPYRQIRGRRPSRRGFYHVRQSRHGITHNTAQPVVGVNSEWSAYNVDDWKGQVVRMQTALRMTVPTIADQSARFSLSAPAYDDTPSRFSLLVRAFKNAATRLRLVSRGYGPEGVGTASDAFTDTAGTTLQSHTADTGQSWSAQSSENAAISAAGRVYGVNGSATVPYGMVASPGSADYEVTATATYIAVGAPSGGVSGRSSSDGTLSGYSAYVWYAFNSGGGPQGYKLSRFINGVETQLGLSSHTFSVNEAHALKLGMVGDQISGYVDGVLTIGPITDTQITAPGVAGTFQVTGLTGGSAAGMQLDDWSATNMAGFVSALDARFSLVGLALKDAAARVRLLGQTLRDAGARAAFQVRSFIDAPARLRVVARTYATEAARAAVTVPGFVWGGLRGDSTVEPGWPHIFTMSDGYVVAVGLDDQRKPRYWITSDPAPEWPHTAGWTAQISGTSTALTKWARNGDTLYGLMMDLSQYNLTLVKLAYSSGTHTIAVTTALVQTTSGSTELWEPAIAYDATNGLVHLWTTLESPFGTYTSTLRAWDPATMAEVYTTSAPGGYYADDAHALVANGSELFLVHLDGASSSPGQIHVKRAVAGASSYTTTPTDETGIPDTTPDGPNRLSATFDGTELVVIWQTAGVTPGILVLRRTAANTYPAYARIVSASVTDMPAIFRRGGTSDLIVFYERTISGAHEIWQIDRLSGEWDASPGRLAVAVSGKKIGSPSVAADDLNATRIARFLYYQGQGNYSAFDNELIAASVQARVRGYKDAGARARLVVRSFLDAGSRVRVVGGASRDAGARFSLTSVNAVLKDAAARAVVTARSYRDAGARAIVQVRGYRDASARTRVVGQTFKTAKGRFLLQFAGQTAPIVALAYQADFIGLLTASSPHKFRMSDGKYLAIVWDGVIGPPGYTIKTGTAWSPLTYFAGLQHNLQPGQTKTCRNGDDIYVLTGMDTDFNLSGGSSSVRLFKLAYSAGAVTVTQVLCDTNPGGASEAVYGVYFDPVNSLIHCSFTLDDWHLQAYDTSLGLQYSTLLDPYPLTSGLLNRDGFAAELVGDGGATMLAYGAGTNGAFDVEEVYKAVAGASSYTVTKETNAPLLPSGPPYPLMADAIWDGTRFILFRSSSDGTVKYVERTGTNAYGSWTTIVSSGAWNDDFRSSLSAWRRANGDLIVFYVSTASQANGEVWAVVRRNGNWQAPFLVVGGDAGYYRSATSSDSDVDESDGIARFMYLKGDPAGVQQVYEATLALREKDAAARARLVVRAYRDGQARASIVVRSFRDAPARAVVTVRSYLDAPTRFRIVVGAARDARARSTIIARSYIGAGARYRLAIARDIAARARVVARSYRDAQARATVTARSSRDAAARATLQVRAFRDAGARARVTARSYRDATARAVVQVRSFRDVGARARVVGGGTKDAQARLRLTARSYRDAPARLAVFPQRIRDAAARARVIGRSYRDAAWRLNITTAQSSAADAKARLRLTARSYRDAPARARLVAAGASDARARFASAVRSARDAGGRLRLVGPGYATAAARARVVVQAARDARGRLAVTVEAHRDARARLAVVGRSLRDAPARLGLAVVAAADAPARIVTTAGSYADATWRTSIRAAGATDARWRYAVALPLIWLDAQARARVEAAQARQTSWRFVVLASTATTGPTIGGDIGAARVGGALGAARARGEIGSVRSSGSG